LTSTNVATIYIDRDLRQNLLRCNEIIGEQDQVNDENRKLKETVDSLIASYQRAEIELTYCRDNLDKAIRRIKILEAGDATEARLTNSSEDEKSQTRAHQLKAQIDQMKSAAAEQVRESEKRYAFTLLKHVERRQSLERQCKILTEKLDDKLLECESLKGQLDERDKRISQLLNTVEAIQLMRMNFIPLVTRLSSLVLRTCKQ
jgi:hypothetical protein